MHGSKLQVAPRRAVKSDWVPAAVKSMAEAMPNENPIAQRLLTDERMKKVWPVLRRQKLTKEEIPSSLSELAYPPTLQLANLNSRERLKHWDIPDRDVPLQDQACAALFAFAVIEFTVERSPLTKQQVDTLAEPWLRAADLCLESVRSDPAVRIDSKLTAALKLVAGYFEQEVKLLQHKGNPYFIPRPSGKRGHSDDIRTKGRALAAATIRIFGSTLYSTVATVMMVALDVDNISLQDVRNWSADLPRH